MPDSLHLLICRYFAGEAQAVLDSPGFEAGVDLVKATFTNDKGTYTKTLKSVVVR